MEKKDFEFLRDRPGSYSRVNNECLLVFIIWNPNKYNIYKKIFNRKISKCTTKRSKTTKIQTDNEKTPAIFKEN